MKLIFLILLIIFTFSTSLKEDSEATYLLISNKNFTPDLLGYKAFFSIKSTDKRFQGDVYKFRIDYKSLDYQSLYSLGTLVDLDTIHYLQPEKAFKSISNCELHEKLSLLKNAYIITELPNTTNNSKKEYMI